MSGRAARRVRFGRDGSAGTGTDGERRQPDHPFADRGRGEIPPGGERLEAGRRHHVRLPGDVVQPAAVGVGRYGAAARPGPHPRRRSPAALPARSLSGLINASVVRVTAAHAAVLARNGAAVRPAARLVWSVLMDNPGCLTASPDPHHVTRCDSPSTRFHASHCGGRGVPRGSRPQPGRFRRPVSWWRALRAWGTPGQDCPGADMSPRATAWRLHAREPPVPAQVRSLYRQRSLPAAWGHATL